MDPATTFVIGGTQKAVQSTFHNIFETVTGRARAWMEIRKLAESGSEKYAEFFARRVGVFPLFATTASAAIDDAFVRVCVTDRPDREIYKSRAQLVAELLDQKRGQTPALAGVPTPPLDAINTGSGGFALLGGPGSGKTTILRHVAMYLAKGGTVRGEARLPIFVALRDLGDHQSISDSLVAFLSGVGVHEPQRVLTALLESGKAAILLDGVDEVSSAHQADIIREVEELQQRYSSALFCFSARPHALAKGMGTFQKWETVPFAFPDRLEFSRRWFDIVDRKKGDRFIEECQKSPGLVDLGSNPLLLSIVCALYHNDLDVPREPNELFARAVEGMLGGWDNFRAIARTSVLSCVSLPRRVLLLSAIAANMFERRQIVFGADELAASGVVPKLSQRFSTPLPEEADLLATLSNDYGLLVERSPRLFSFSHLTLHEFLVARYIVDNRLEITLLNTHRTDPSWREVVVLVAKLLPNADDYLASLFRGVRLQEGGDISLLARVSSMLPNCDPSLRRGLVHEFASRIMCLAKQIGGEFSREGDKITLKFPTGAQIPRIIATIRMAREWEEAETQSIALAEAGIDGSAVKAKGRAGKSKKRAAPIPFANSFVICGYLTEIAQVLRDGDFDAEPGGFLNSSLMRALVGGPVPANRFEFEVEQA